MSLRPVVAMRRRHTVSDVTSGRSAWLPVPDGKASSTLVMTSPKASGSAINQLWFPGTVTISGSPRVVHMSSNDARVINWSL